jgi:hypothetical protein
MPSDSEHDLLWLAFRYVTSEMDADEVSAFETRLSHDQAAREAVAEAVQLVGAVSLASSSDEVLSLRRSARGWRPWFAAAAAAACVIFVVGYREFASSRALPALPASKLAGGNGPDDAVALAWSALFEGEDDAPLASGEVLAWLDESEIPGDSDPALSAITDADGNAVSPWMMEAASLRDELKPAGSEPKEN